MTGRWTTAAVPRARARLGTDRHLDAGSESLPLPRDVGGCTVWFAGVPWDDVQGTDRMLVEAIDEPVVWVDGVRSPLRRGGRWLPARYGGIRVLRSDPLLVRVSPAALPLFTRQGVRGTTAPLMRRQVRSVLRLLGARPHTVVVSYLSDLFGVWGDEAVEVLLGTDDYVAGAELMGVSSSWLMELEAMSIREADVVMAVSDDLAAKWRGMGADVQLLRNGCKVVPEGPRSDDVEVLDDRSPAIVGLVGQLSSRIDIAILEAIADSGARLLLVGPTDPRWEPARFAALCRRDSVEYTGAVPAEEVPGHLKRMHVGITPYLDSAFNRSSFPLKTLEYLGAGLPVVTTDLPASRWIAQDMTNHLGTEAIRPHLAIATSAADFVSQVHRLAGLRGGELPEERKVFASRHSWSRRAETLRLTVDSVRNSR